MIRKLIIDTNAKRYRFDAAKDFKGLRSFLMLSSNCELIGLARLVDIIDDIKELAVGETMYVCPSKNSPSHSKDLEDLNRFCSSLSSACERGVVPAKYYEPRTSEAFSVKRTERSYIYQTLDTNWRECGV